MRPQNSDVLRIWRRSPIPYTGTTDIAITARGTSIPRSCSLANAAIQMTMVSVSNLLRAGSHSPFGVVASITRDMAAGWGTTRGTRTLGTIVGVKQGGGCTWIATLVKRGCESMLFDSFSYFSCVGESIRYWKEGENGQVKNR
jgi:hypothetical protein